MAGDDPTVAGDDLDRDRLVDPLVVQPEERQLVGAVQDRCVRPPQLRRERLCHGLVEAQRVAQDPEVIGVIAADVDPQQLVVADAIDRLVAQVHLAIGPIAAERRARMLIGPPNAASVPGPQ